jgi:hypothetical protein
MNDQEIYETVKQHLLTQNSKAIVFDGENQSCAYRTPDNKKCAVGCLIKNEFYFPLIEGKEIYNNLVKDSLILSVKYLPNMSMMNALQHLHDRHEVKDWKSILDAHDSNSIIDWCIKHTCW